ncbi:MAG: hypothetical protein J0H42_29810 [Rhizobiales bacterium]|nr:hypothetical protein [Hyphomicrobiales bacterium]
MGYAWIVELGMIAVEIYYDCKERNEKPEARDEKPLPKIVGSVPHVPLTKLPSSDR